MEMKKQFITLMCINLENLESLESIDLMIPQVELIKEVQRMLLNNNYSVISAKIIGDFMRKNMETTKRENPLKLSWMNCIKKSKKPNTSSPISTGCRNDSLKQNMKM